RNLIPPPRATDSCGYAFRFLFSQTFAQLVLIILSLFRQKSNLTSHQSFQAKIMHFFLSAVSAAARSKAPAGTNQPFRRELFCN
ncbi:hypothetical protein, partial [Agathobaculum sp.]|uniref:hypothetical protein n=1 Tax=Agathobaculum sp. TaxID=2048138 RepID=UPI003AB52FDC